MKKHLPLPGVGPFIVLGFLTMTLFGIYLDYTETYSFKLENIKGIIYIVSLFISIAGILIWREAFFKSKILKNVKNNNLVTNGIYAYTRNPIYTGWFMLFSGILLSRYNLTLLLVILCMYVYASTLVFLIEEKWLYEMYGDRYLNYKKKVNRFIPWKREN